jgi:hypothetical protein
MINKVVSIKEIIALFHRDAILTVAGESKIVGVLVAYEIQLFAWCITLTASQFEGVVGSTALWKLHVKNKSFHPSLNRDHLGFLSVK